MSSVSETEPTRPYRPSPLLIAFLIALGAIAWLGFSGLNGGPAAPGVMDSTDAILGCETMVRERLKAPATARFSDPHAGDALDELGGSNIVWRGHVDAENSFGANLRTPFVCTVEDEQVRVVLGP